MITGGAGFIGCRLSQALLDVGRSVVVLDSLHPQVHTTLGRPDDLPEAVGLFCGDVAESATWDRLFQLHGLPRVVYHLAAETGTGQSLLEATRHSTANVVGTTQLTDALSRHEHQPEHLIITSSRAVYGEGAWADADARIFYPPPRSAGMLAAGQWDPAASEGQAVRPLGHDAATTWPRPTNVYAATKLAQEHLLEAWCSSFGVPLSILRLQNVFGPGQAVGNAYTGVLTFFARQLASGQQIDVYEDGNIIRDFVFVGDVVDALVATEANRPLDVRRVDIGSGVATTLLEVAETMTSIASGTAPFVSGRYRHGDVRAAFADVSSAGTELGWMPRVPLRSGLEALLKWVPSQL